jgi:hypothetical protein
MLVKDKHFATPPVASGDLKKTPSQREGVSRWKLEGKCFAFWKAKRLYFSAFCIGFLSFGGFEKSNFICY